MKQERSSGLLQPLGTRNAGAETSLNAVNAAFNAVDAFADTILLGIPCVMW